MNRTTGGKPFPNPGKHRRIQTRMSQAARLTGCLLPWLVLAASAQAQDGRREAFRFLEMASGGRLAALGGNHAALLSPDAGSVLSNPAFLIASESEEIGIQTSRLPAGITRAGADWVNPFRPAAGREGRRPHTYLGVRSVLYGAMDRLDETGEADGTFRSFDSQWSVGAAVPLGGGWAVGAGGSLVVSSYGEWTSSAYSLSAGTSWTAPGGDLSGGLVIRNLGGNLSSWTDVREPLPFRVALGIAHKPAYFPARLHLTAAENADGRLDPDILAGAEFLFSEQFQFRLGFHSGVHNDLKTASRLDMSGVQAGIGLRIRDIRIDLSRTSWGRLGGILHIGVQGL